MPDAGENIQSKGRAGESKGRAGELPRRPLRDRRARLEDIVAGSELVFAVRRLAPNGLVVWQQVFERRYEGYVAKDERSAYEGEPPKHWLKVKVPGWTVAEDHCRRSFLRHVSRHASNLSVTKQ